MTCVVPTPILHTLEETVVSSTKEIIALIPTYKTCLSYVTQGQSTMYIVTSHLSHLTTRVNASTKHGAPMGLIQHQLITFLINLLIIEQYTGSNNCQGCWSIPRRMRVCVSAELAACGIKNCTHLRKEKVTVLSLPSLIKTTIRIAEHLSSKYQGTRWILIEFSCGGLQSGSPCRQDICCTLGISLIACYMPLYGINHGSISVLRRTLALSITSAYLCTSIGGISRLGEIIDLHLFPKRSPRLVTGIDMSLDPFQV